MNNICVDEYPHALIPYAWQVSKEKKKVTSFICANCWESFNTDDMIAAFKSQTDTSAQHSSRDEQSSHATQQPHT